MTKLHFFTYVFLNDVLQFQIHDLRDVLQMFDQLYSPPATLVPRLQDPDIFNTINVIIGPVPRDFLQRAFRRCVVHARRPILTVDEQRVMMDDQVIVRQELVPFEVPDFRKLPVDVQVFFARDEFIAAINGEGQRRVRHPSIHRPYGLLFSRLVLDDEPFQETYASRNAEIVYEIVVVIWKT